MDRGELNTVAFIAIEPRPISNNQPATPNLVYIKNLAIDPAPMENGDGAPT